MRAPRPPQRQIAEEDECPVCGNELPPKGPGGDETARERHVEECIAGHFVGGDSGGNNRSSTASAAAMSAPDLLAAAAGTASASSAPSAMSPLSIQDSAGRERASSSAAVGSPSDAPRRRATGNRMLTYIATEKDCVGDDGEPAECIICLEEYEAGQEMGRLNCLCKFHKVSCTDPTLTEKVRELT